MRIPLITEIQRYSLQDGIGIRTTIFVKGCPLCCPWCHNPETQSTKKEFYYYKDRCQHCGRCAAVCPTGASSMRIGAGDQPVLEIDRSRCIACMKCVGTCLSGARAVTGQELTIDEIVAEAAADLPFYKNSGGGVTISGGEPLLFPEFTLELAKRLKARGINVGIETCCFAKWERIEPLLEYLDFFIVDIKSLNSRKHEEVVGWPLKPILENVDLLLNANAAVRIHLPIIPGFNDSQEDFRALIDYLEPRASKLLGADILPYHVYAEGKYEFLHRGDSYQYKGVAEPPIEDIWPLALALKRIGIAEVTVGGLVGVKQEKKALEREGPPSDYDTGLRC